MMNPTITKTNKKRYITASVILLFVITNPSPAAFHNYKGFPGHRKYNFFICSIYTVTYIPESRQTINQQYLAILGNFFLL